VECQFLVEKVKSKVWMSTLKNCHISGIHVYLQAAGQAPVANHLRSYLLSTPETLDNWMDRRPCVMLALSTDMFSCSSSLLFCMSRFSAEKSDPTPIPPEFWGVPLGLDCRCCDSEERRC